MMIYRLILLNCFVFVGVAVSSVTVDACTDSLIRIDLASLHYRATFIVARLPAQLFSMKTAYISRSTEGLVTLSDSLPLLIERSVQLDTADYPLDYPDARLSVLLTRKDGVPVMISFGGHRMLYGDQLYRLNPDIIELFYPFLPDDHVADIVEFLRLAKYRP